MLSAEKLPWERVLRSACATLLLLGIPACSELLPDDMDSGPEARDAGAESGTTGSAEDDSEQRSEDQETPEDQEPPDTSSSCPQGSEPDEGGDCRDIDECERDLHDCSTNPPACVNRQFDSGRYECLCPAGWTGSGIGEDGCQDIDECARGTDSCDDDPLVECNNTRGGFTCGDCPAGFDGDSAGGSQGCTPLLDALSLPSGRLTPDFDPLVTRYEVTLAGWQDTWHLAASGRSGFTVRANGELLDASNFASFPAQAESRVDVDVNAGGASRRYEVTVRAMASQAYLKPLKDVALTGSDRVGHRLAISGDGNTLAFSAPMDSSCQASPLAGAAASDTGCGQAGAVYVHVHGDTGWKQQAFIKASNAEQDDLFGISLDLSDDGNLLVVGSEDERSCATGPSAAAPTADPTDNDCPRAGAVYVFARNGETWTQQAYLKPSNTDSRWNAFGHAVSLSDDGHTLAVGAPEEDSCATYLPFGSTPQEDNACDESGAAYLFKYNAEAWTQTRYVKASDTRATGRFGSDVDLSSDGETLVVSAVSPPTVYVYEPRNGSWGWSATLAVASTNTSYAHPVAVDGAGRRIVTGLSHTSRCVGDQQGSACATKAGALFIFDRLGGVWQPDPQVLFADHAEKDDELGFGLTMNTSGTMIAATAYGEDACGPVGGSAPDPLDDECFNAGAAYVFGLTGDSWSQLGYVKPEAVAARDGLQTIAMSSGELGSTTLVLGAPAEDGCTAPTDDDCPDQGAIYVLE